MKNILVLCGLFYLSACVYAGDVNVWKGRGDWVESFQTYPLTYWSHEPKLVKITAINEKTYAVGEIRTAFKGYSVLSEKTFDRSYFVTEKVKANMNVTFSSVSAPYRYKKNHLEDIIASTTIDGKDYRLIKTDLKDFVLVVDDDGKFWKGGQIRNNRLQILAIDYIPSNLKFRFEPVMITTTEQSRPNKGFDIKYDGVKLNRMWFTYFDYATDTAGGFREYSFPKKPGLLTIGEAKIRVLDADDQRIDYMIISE